jgi:Zn-finger nucleic acid-binding protein
MQGARKRCPQSTIERCPHCRGLFPAKTARGDREVFRIDGCPLYRGVHMWRFYCMLNFWISTEVQSKEDLYSAYRFDQIRHQTKIF